jgi:hypothetical protein
VNVAVAMTPSARIRATLRQPRTIDKPAPRSAHLKKQIGLAAAIGRDE